MPRTNPPSRPACHPAATRRLIRTVDRIVANGSVPRPARLAALTRALRTALNRPGCSDPELASTALALAPLVQELHSPLEAQFLAERALQLFEERWNAQPRNAVRANNVAVAILTLGDLARESGALDVAEQSCRRAERIVATFRTGAPLDCLRTKALYHERLGQLAQLRQHHGIARRRFAQALRLARQLVRRDHSDTDYRRGLSVCHMRLALLALDLRHFPTARRHLTRVIALRRHLLRQEPANPLWHDNLARAEATRTHLRIESRRAKQRSLTFPSPSRGDNEPF